MTPLPAETLDDPRPPLAYATAYARSPRIWAAAVLLAGGLGLIALGGCFLIGVLILNLQGSLQGAPPPTVWTPGLIVFAAILYVLAFSCFAAASVLIVRTTRTLLRAVEG